MDTCPYTLVRNYRLCNIDGNCSLWVIVMCPCRFTGGNKYLPLVANVENEGVFGWRGDGEWSARGKSIPCTFCSILLWVQNCSKRENLSKTGQRASSAFSGKRDSSHWQAQSDLVLLFVEISSPGEATTPITLWPLLCPALYLGRQVSLENLGATWLIRLLQIHGLKMQWVLNTTFSFGIFAFPSLG